MEITANAIQTVAANQNILFPTTTVPGSCSMVHRVGSGLVTLRGLGQQARARFQIWFGGNVAVSTGETLAPILLAITLGGETLPATQMIVTPAAVEDFFNVSASVFLDIPSGCCQNISVKNIGTADIDVQNANLIIERVA